MNDHDDEQGKELEEECEPESEGSEPVKADKKKPSTAVANVAKAAPLAVTHVYPFNVRYAAEILDLSGFIDGQAYTGDQIKDLLVQNGFTEFQDLAPSFHLSAATNTLVITIQGSKKGGDGLPEDILTFAAASFESIHARFGTEDRILVYRSAATGLLHLKQTVMSRSPGSVTCDVPLSLDRSGGEIWDLAYDLHSHHVMGAFWSAQDNAAERIRGPVFGVYSWKADKPTWLFRRFNGTDYEDLSPEQVVARS